MVDVLMLLWTGLNGLFRSRVRLEAEVLVSPAADQCAAAQFPKRFVFRTFDRLVFVGLYRLVPGIVDALAIVRPETVVAGTVLDFDRSGVGNPDGAAGDQESRWRSAS